ncbi:MAG: circularly permuted type 2 ATP-grasp protein [Burkholderiaceae bacterium]
MTKSLFDAYDSGGFYCEMFADGKRPPAHTRALVTKLSKIKESTLRRRAKAIDAELFNLGITFTVYSEKERIDRILPFDVIPRILSRQEWNHIEQGCVQRVNALNEFIYDVYHGQKILRDKIIPAELVLENSNFCKHMIGFDPPQKTYVHIAGVDLVRGGDGEFCVLEDNARTPSGVSYVVENRHLMRRAFPDLMDTLDVMPVSDYGSRLRNKLGQVVPKNAKSELVVLLSPGVFNSAYFEHVFLAREMGAPLVEGRDLVVQDDRVYMRTTDGLRQVHVIYRRIDDAFLDPECFNPESMLGVRGLMKAYLAGNVNIANAVGTGFADDKEVYSYMPAIIKYYLDQDPILPIVPTNACRDKKMLDYTLENLESLVVKPVGESGGYGVVVGPRASKEELQATRRLLRAKPSNFISQPLIQLSVCPTLCENGIDARHVDLRPYVLTGKDSWVLPGGLTRVAMRKGSFVVNSSQGGGTKDTWVIG